MGYCIDDICHGAGPMCGATSPEHCSIGPAYVGEDHACHDPDCEACFPDDILVIDDEDLDVDDVFSADDLADLEAELLELERTDPAVANYRETVDRLTGRASRRTTWRR